MAKRSDADVALEMYQSVMQSNNKQRRLRSSTFWDLFRVKSRQKSVIERICKLIDEQGLRLEVKSGDNFGEERGDDWIILSPKSLPNLDKDEPIIQPTEIPPTKWFELMQSRKFESEREVEAYFIAPLLENLGYEYEDIVIGYPVEMFKGVQKTKTEADFVTFNGTEREITNVLLVVEAKKNFKGINADHIGQARSYAQVLFPVCYMVTDGEQIMVFQFNGSLVPDERVLDFSRMELQEKWGSLYRFISKEATIQRKELIQRQLANLHPK